jgi:hypothetical protein
MGFTVPDYGFIENTVTIQKNGATCSVGSLRHA